MEFRHTVDTLFPHLANIQPNNLDGSVESLDGVGIGR